MHKKNQKDDKKEPVQQGQAGTKDLLKEAIFALGGDTEDYKLVKDISEDEGSASGNAAAEDDVST